jgi:hypothetical protein
MMKGFKILQLFASLTLVFAGSVFAQLPTISTTSDAVAAGDPVTIDLNWDNIGQVSRTLQFDLLYDPAVLTSVDRSACPNPAYFIIGTVVFECVEAEPGRVAFGLLINTAAGVETGTVGTLTFTTNPNAPAAVYNFAFENVLLENDAPVSTVPGSVEILPPPQPDWSSVPNSATGLDWFNRVVDTGAHPLPLQVTNAGEAGSTLTGSCQVSGSSVFGIVGDNSLGAGLAMDASQDITVACDTTSATLELHQGTLSCEHNGDGTTESSITDYALSCNITTGPQPAFSGTPNGLDSMSVPEEGDLPEPSGTLSVQNTGDPTTLLSGSCSASGGDAGKFSVSNGSFTDLAAQDDSGPTHIVTVSCNTSEEGNFTSSLACEYGAAGSPTNYPLACTVGPPGAAVFGSTIAPAVGAEVNIDLTPGGVVQDAAVTPIPLNISNDAPEANDLDLPFSCSYAGDSAISVGSMSGSPLAPMTSAGGVSFGCDTSAVGPFSGTYTCTYSEDGGATDQMADWNVSCEVREPESDVDPSPVSGTQRPIRVVPGGTGQTSVNFREVLDEGETGSLTGCTLVDNTAFTIVSSTAYPIEISSGGTVVVVIEGTDTGSPADNTATLECTYSDTGGSQGFGSWPLVIIVAEVGIPTMGAWGQILMILSLLALGLAVLRRRRIFD